jgi:putative CRISPR-associated protein (TIGR02619 family)
MRTALLCTVGTSLKNNLKTLQLDTEYDQSNFSRVSRALLQLNPAQRECGAEINSIEEVCSRRQLDLLHIVLFVSDTEDGKAVGKILKSYFEQRSDLSLNSVEVQEVAKLQDEDPKDFKVHGLRNLVRSVGRNLRRFGHEQVAINATGGYKAQIAIAVLLGQALDIPVFYKHERFSEIIDFPPLPISFDYDVLGRNSSLLTDFERGEALAQSEVGKLDEKLRAMLEEIEVDGEPVYELSPIGQIYVEGFRYRNPKPTNLACALERKPPSFRDDHYPKGFKEFVNKVWRENDWIVTANSLPYDKQKSIKGIGFDVREVGDKRRLVGTYTDKDNFGARYRLHLTDESMKALSWAADQLNQHYRPLP